MIGRGGSMAKEREKTALREVCMLARCLFNQLVMRRKPCRSEDDSLSCLCV
jgi:hypothetical protein